MLSPIAAAAFVDILNPKVGKRFLAITGRVKISVLFSVPSQIACRSAARVVVEYYGFARLVRMKKAKIGTV